MRPTAAEALQHPWFDRGGFHNPRHGPVESMADLLERCFRRMHDFCQRTQLQKTIMCLVSIQDMFRACFDVCLFFSLLVHFVVTRNGKDKQQRNRAVHRGSVLGYSEYVLFVRFGGVICGSICMATPESPGMAAVTC